MISDHIRNRDKCYGLGENYRITLDYLPSVTEETASTKQDVYLKNNAVFVKIRPMMTKEPSDAKCEAHTKYADSWWSGAYWHSGCLIS